MQYSCTQCRDQAAPLTQNVRRVLFQGYKTLEDAEAAYNYAAARSWTGVCSTMSTPTPSSRLLRHQMPTPIDDEVTISPLHYGTWYTVYKGVEPGVYQSLYVSLCITRFFLTERVPQSRVWSPHCWPFGIYIRFRRRRSYGKGAICGCAREWSHSLYPAPSVK
jgi:hypothetical protein